MIKIKYGPSDKCHEQPAVSRMYLCKVSPSNIGVKWEGYELATNSKPEESQRLQSDSGKHVG